MYMSPPCVYSTTCMSLCMFVHLCAYHRVPPCVCPFCVYIPSVCMSPSRGCLIRVYVPPFVCPSVSTFLHVYIPFVCVPSCVCPLCMCVPPYVCSFMCISPLRVCPTMCMSHHVYVPPYLCFHRVYTPPCLYPFRVYTPLCVYPPCMSPPCVRFTMCTLHHTYVSPRVHSTILYVRLAVCISPPCVHFTLSALHIPCSVRSAVCIVKFILCNITLSTIRVVTTLTCSETYHHRESEFSFKFRVAM